MEHFYHSIHYKLQTGRSCFNFPRCSFIMSAIRGKIKACNRTQLDIDPQNQLWPAFRPGESLSCQQKCSQFVFKIWFSETWVWLFACVEKLKTTLTSKGSQDVPYLLWISFQDLSVCAFERHATLGQPRQNIPTKQHWSNLLSPHVQPHHPLNVSLSTRLKMPRVLLPK